MDENSDKQLEAYNDLLLGRMLPDLVKKRNKKERTNKDKGIIADHKEYDMKQEEHVKLEKRIMDAKSLSQLNAECDNMSADLTKCFNLMAQYNLKETLVKLRSNLNSLLVLQTKNIQLPETKEEIECFLNIVQSCFDKWKEVDLSKFMDTSKKVKSNMNTYSGDVAALDSTIQELINTVSELQLLVLKHTSESLTDLSFQE